MSNALARKKKRMQTLGYSKSELIGIQSTPRHKAMRII